MARRIIITLAVALGFTAGGLALSEARAAGEWQDMGSANGVQAWRFTDGKVSCYVTSTGGISCLK